jgi:hypothetical protein
MAGKSGDDDDLRLNTLHRFAKHSPRLVLHEYSHCEVPAGCGGVILRWYDRAQGAPAMVRVRGEEIEADCWLDGAPLASSFALLGAGARVLAVHVRRTQPSAVPRPFTVAITFDDDRGDNDLLARIPSRWHAAAAAPAEGWPLLGGGEAGWSEPRLASAELIAAQGEWMRHELERAAAEGRRVLALEADELWLRIAFAVPAADAPGPEPEEP